MRKTNQMFSLLAIVAIFITTLVFAADLKTYKEKYVKALADIIIAHGNKMTEMAEQYTKSLEALQTRVQKKGDLDSVEAVMTESERFSKEKTVSEAVSKDGFSDLKDLQLSYMRRARTLNTAKARRILSLADNYYGALAELQTDLTRQGKLEEAAQAREDKRSVKDSLDVIAAQTMLQQYTKETSSERVAPPQTTSRSKWFLLFHSSDPSIWNSELQETGRFALPLERVPDDMRYLRMSKSSGKDFVIIPLDKESLLHGKSEGKRYIWQGSHALAHEGYHLGILDKNSRGIRGNGKSYVTIDRAYSDKRGWGFGHRFYANDRQGYAWACEEIAETDIRIEVTAQDLTRAEQDNLLR